jgi:mRNA-binding protein PUF3
MGIMLSVRHPLHVCGVFVVFAQNLTFFKEKLLAQLKGVERERFVEDMRPHLNVLKKYNYGKQITAIEKLISNGLPPQTAPMEINSSAATPVLTMEQNSPESSSLPSTNASTVDGPTQPSSIKTVVAEKAKPEVEFELIQ